jgi:alkylhydroperoxidase/carboxymuconolactone decarboxylase family protein YurZ
LQEQAPNIARGFAGLHQAVMKERALSVRAKELIALGISLASHCTPCVN